MSNLTEIFDSSKARAAGDDEAAQQYQKLFTNGSRWWDEYGFNGEYYIQDIRPSIRRSSSSPKALSSPPERALVLRDSRKSKVRAKSERLPHPRPLLPAGEG